METIYHSGQHLHHHSDTEGVKVTSVQSENTNLLDSLSEFFVTGQTSDSDTQYITPRHSTDGYIDSENVSYSLQESSQSLVDDPQLDVSTDLSAPHASDGNDILTQATRSIMDPGMAEDYYPGAKRMRTNPGIGESYHYCNIYTVCWFCVSVKIAVQVCRFEKNVILRCVECVPITFRSAIFPWWPS